MFIGVLEEDEGVLVSVCGSWVSSIFLSSVVSNSGAETVKTNEL